MNNLELLLVFITICVTTWIFLISFFAIFLNPGRLTRKKYSSEYIQFIRKDYKNRIRGIALAIPILLLISLGIFWLIAGRPLTYNHLTVVFLIFFLLIVPFPILDYLKSKKRYKKLAFHTSAEVVFDLNHQKLHKFFNPRLELILSILFILFHILIFNLPFMVYIHLGIPWILYISVLKSKYSTLPMLRDGFLYSFIFMELNYALIIFYIARYAVFCQSCLNATHQLLSGLLIIVMLSRMIYYILNFRKVYQAMSQ